MRTVLHGNIHDICMHLFVCVKRQSPCKCKTVHLDVFQESGIGTKTTCQSYDCLVWITYWISQSENTSPFAPVFKTGIHFKNIFN